ncbi:MAG: hypothetical protein R3F13_11505 [Prosthecobacter sp.]
MSSRPILRGTLTVLIAALLWLAWWVFGRSPEAQIRAAQANLTAAIEDRDWDEVAAFLAESYTDAYGNNRESAITHGKKLLGGFYTLSILTDQTTVRAAKGQGMVQTMIRLEGNGIGYSHAVLGRVNQLSEPWIFHWSNPGTLPWNWQVTMIHNDQIR